MPAGLTGQTPVEGMRGYSMIRKSVQRFSEKIMLKQQPKAR